MSAATPLVMPYERQLDPQTSRMCGAACLSMVYRSFGKTVFQADIWPQISKPNRFGTLSSTTYLMAQDACHRGYSAAAIQAKHPLRTLLFCHQRQVRVILNHRVAPNSRAGHYSVLAEIDSRSVVLRDPFNGPTHRLTFNELLEVWRPCEGSEIAGNFLIALAPKAVKAEPCPLCRTPFPDHVDCPRCKTSVALSPWEGFGCIAEGCKNRLWNYLCCPACDYTWSFSPEPMEQPQPAPARNDATSEVPPHIATAFAQLDKLVGTVRGLPAAMANADVVAKLAELSECRERILVACAEMTANLKVRDERVAEMVKKADAKREEHRAKMEELTRGMPPLDGDALGHALLKNIGFIPT